MKNNKSLFYIIFFFSISFLSAKLLVDKVMIKGNYLINTEKIKRVISTASNYEYDQTTAFDDVKKINKLYDKEGIYQVMVFPVQIEILENNLVDVIFNIEESEQYSINKLIFNGNDYIKSEKIIAQLPVGEISIKKIPEILQIIVEFYADNGFLFSKAEVDSLRQENNKIDLFINIKEGKFCRFENYKFSGNKVTKDETILKITQLNRIDIINPDILQIAEEKLRKKPYIRDSEIIPFNENDLIFKIIEDKMTLFSGIIGFDNDQPKNDRLNGLINIDFLNLFGSDRTLSLRWQKLHSSREIVEFFYHESGPNIFPISGDFSLLREEVDSTYIKTLFETEIYFYNIINRYGIYFAYDDIFPGKAQTIEKIKFQKLGAFWEFDNLDYHLNPRQGYNIFLKYYTIFNKVDNININKNAIESTFFTIRNISGNLFFSVKTNAKVIENKKLNNLEYFELGGNADLRGFMENQFWGYRLSWTNVEMRYLLSRKSRIFLFTDHGFVQNELYKYGKLFGFGFGMRVETKIGLFGIDYGVSYNQKIKNPMNGIIHFGIETKL